MDTPLESGNDPELSREIPADNPFLRLLKKHEEARAGVITAASVVLRRKSDGPTYCHVPRDVMDNMRRAFKTLDATISELKNMHKQMVPPTAQSPIPDGNPDQSSKPQ